jgi:hypothetical protein
MDGRDHDRVGRDLRLEDRPDRLRLPGQRRADLLELRIASPSPVPRAASSSSPCTAGS